MIWWAAPQKYFNDKDCWNGRVATFSYISLSVDKKMPLFLVDVMNIIKRMIDALFDSIMRVVEFKGHLEPDE